MHAWDPISASIGSTLRIAANPGAHVPARAVIAKVGLVREGERVDDRSVGLHGLFGQGGGGRRDLNEV
jgi:hypothetical protein